MLLLRGESLVGPIAKDSVATMLAAAEINGGVLFGGVSNGRESGATM